MSIPIKDNASFGKVDFKNMDCKAYTMFYGAMKTFRERTEMSLPYKTLTIRTGVHLRGDSPYSTTNVVRIPPTYPLSYMDMETANHELAHTVRQTLDGSFIHLLYDVARFNYLRKHKCNSTTNEGFAFNEGWSEFWAGSCKGPWDRKPVGQQVVSSLDSKEMQVEGNVANAIRRLQKVCDSSYHMLVALLRSYRGKIHSFEEFNNYHYQRYHCKL